MELAALTTLRVGGPAGEYVESHETADLCGTVQAADASGRPVLLVGGGSNLVVADEGFAGTVVAVRTSGRQVRTDGSDVLVELAAGEVWDDVVDWSVGSGFGGLETLAGIPGRVGATPIQNVGAYGTEMGDVLESVLVLDRIEGERLRLSPAACALAYRTSRFKSVPDRFVILEVSLRLTNDGRSRPVKYLELAQALDVTPASRRPVAEVVAAVRGLRAAKAMLLDDGDHDTWSVGSFFTNPILDVADTVPASVARWALPDGRVKLSAAGLLEAAGFAKGYAPAHGRVAISSKHSLALTNRGAATTADVIALAREVRDGVASRFGIELQVEPTLVGVRF